jgi:hypothetical protein
MRKPRSEDRRCGRHGVCPVSPGLLAIGGCLLLGAGLAVAQRPQAGPREVRRARPPASWDKAAEGTFYDDAFATLEGTRPVFARPSGGGREPTPSAGGPADEKTFKWSAIVSGDTLVDEIKQTRAAAKGAIGKVSDFKAGGYKKVRVAFGVAAAAFGAIAAYDKDVRWKSDAAAARDLLARAGANCKVGTDQSFNEVKDRVDDLDAMLEGSALTSKPDREEDFAWSQVADRSTLMVRLEAAEGLTIAAAASRADFVRQAERLVHEAEITAMVAELLQQPTFADHDDTAYRGHAAAMRAAALSLREAVEKKDHEAARKAVGELKKSCDACHADYRG